jgi:hypothetical protein
MMLFADYEGFAVGWSLIFWGLLTAPALIMGLLGVVAGALRWTGCAAGLGFAACLLELLGVAFVWLCIYGEPVDSSLLSVGRRGNFPAFCSGPGNRLRQPVGPRVQAQEANDRMLRLRQLGHHHLGLPLTHPNFVPLD